MYDNDLIEEQKRYNRYGWIVWPWLACWVTAMIAVAVHLSQGK